MKAKVFERSVKLGRPAGSAVFPSLALAVLAVTAFCALLLAGCSDPGPGEVLVLAVSNDLADSGIEGAASAFGRAKGAEVEIRWVSDEQAMDLLRFGECDVAVSHYRDGLERLLNWNYVTGKAEVMRDEYVLVGPPGDPAGLEGVGSLQDAWKKIAESGALLLAREDGSGASRFVASLVMGIEVPGRGNLVQTVKGDEAELLRSAAERGAYALAMKRYYEASPGGLKVFFRDENSLKDVYYAVAVNPEVYPDARIALASEFIEYLTSEEGQSMLSPSLRVRP
ncbi:MAG: substrate-binding domain-containing protein [Candidatus Geothermincolales bacterium]